MPRYYRRRAYRRPYRRRRYYKKKKSSSGGFWKGAGSLAYRAYKVARYVKSLVNVEFKEHPVDINMNALTNTLNTTANTVFLSGMSVGDLENTRDGQQVRLKRITLRLKYAMHGDNTATNVIRSLLVYTRRIEGGVLPQLAYVLDNNYATKICAPKRIENMKNYHIMADWNTILDPDNLRTKTYTMTKRISIPCTFAKGSQTGDIANALNGHLFLMCYHDQAADVPVVTGSSQLKFLDN